MIIPEKLDTASSLILRDREIRLLRARVEELERRPKPTPTAAWVEFCDSGRLKKYATRNGIWNAGYMAGFNAALDHTGESVGESG